MISGLVCRDDMYRVKNLLTLPVSYNYCKARGASVLYYGLKFMGIISHAWRHSHK